MCTDIFERQLIGCLSISRMSGQARRHKDCLALSSLGICLRKHATLLQKICVTLGSHKIAENQAGLRRLSSGLGLALDLTAFRIHEALAALPHVSYAPIDHICGKAERCALEAAQELHTGFPLFCRPRPLLLAHSLINLSPEPVIANVQLRAVPRDLEGQDSIIFVQTHLTQRKTAACHTPNRA